MCWGLLFFYSAWQCIAVCGSVLQFVVREGMTSSSNLNMRCVAVCCGVLQCVAVCCGVLQCVAVCYPSENYIVEHFENEVCCSLL